MEAELINLNRFKQSGEGANGRSYDSLDDPSLMLKLYNIGYDISSIITEQEVVRKVYDFGLPSPEPGRLVTDGERFGILFKRIAGKRSFARAISEEPDRVDEFASEFARHCKKVHSMECPKGLFPDAKTDFLRLLDSASYLDTETVDAIRNFIVNRIPDCTTALHGDMHIGNALTTLPKGESFDTPHEVYFIDLGYFASGCPLLDIGMLNNICNYCDDGFLEHDFHIKRPAAKRVWNAFMNEYFFGSENLGEKWFGKGAGPEDVVKGMIPYTIVKLLLVGYNLGFLPESYIEFINENKECLK